jgi:nitric oxide reductase NorD protein
MAEAEDVLVDAARHAADYAHGLWLRRRAPGAGGELRLPDVARRLDLLLTGLFGRSFPLHPAQAPVPATWLARWMQRDTLPVQRAPCPATDGTAIWLPPATGLPADEAAERFRVLALHQAMRAVRGAAAAAAQERDPVVRELHLLLEARAAEHALRRLVPGLLPGLDRLRADALAARPPLARIPAALRPLEAIARAFLQEGAAPPDASGWRIPAGLLDLPATPAQVLAQARQLAGLWPGPRPQVRARTLLWHDLWTGEFREPPPALRERAAQAPEEDDGPRAPVRSARLARTPEVRQPKEDEDDAGPGAWMVQTAQPHESAEDPMGMQRPTDRDASTAAEDFADAVSELPEARLVAAPGKPKEVLLSELAPQRSSFAAPGGGAAGERLSYPEWDWRAGAYRHPGAAVLLQAAADGPQEWVTRTLERRAAMLHEVRRRFELLRARRTRLRRQLDGDAIDVDAWIEAQADFRAGLPLSQKLYQQERRARRDLAITLLVDVSGSTDAWIAGDRRIIDVEREALLLVCIALEGLHDPYEVLAFSGEGPQGVVVRHVKAFSEGYGEPVARRIAGLEPEHYTRAGAAVRHATASLMKQAAGHRLLLLLSDGKPNDVDEYEGRYGVEDLRQAVTEARLQGVSPFCLTVDRHAAEYMPHVFGPHHFALLPRPELLPTVLLDWLKRLVSA